MVEERIAFGNLDLVGTTQPHDDALVVTLRIGGFNVKRVIPRKWYGDHVSDLYRGLGLKDEDLTKYDTPISWN